jgi:NADPH:quinone reductase-like Zn-dependent oxidoreductase
MPLFPVALTGYAEYVAEELKDTDVVFDSAAQGERSLSVLRPGGVLVTIVQHRDRPAT